MADDQIPMSGYVATYRGSRHRVLFYGDDWVAVPCDAEQRESFPDALEVGETRGEPWVKLAKNVLTARFSVRVSATWKGVEVQVRRRLPDGRIDLSFTGPPKRARELGMSGDQHQGWYAVVPPDDVTVTDVIEEELS